MVKSMPGATGELADTHPDIWTAYAALGRATAEAGPPRPVREVVAYSETSVVLAGGDRMKWTWRIRRSAGRL